MDCPAQDEQDESHAMEGVSGLFGKDAMRKHTNASLIILRGNCGACRAGLNASTVIEEKTRQASRALLLINSRRNAEVGYFAISAFGTTT